MREGGSGNRSLKIPIILHLIRHATYHLVGHTIGGRAPGLSLDQTGRAEAAQLATILAAKPLAAIVSSPQQRAQETATPIAARHNLPVTTDPGFDEIDFGAWTGQSFEALRPSPEWRVFNTLRSLSLVPGGEAPVAVQARAVASMMRLADAFADCEVAVVSHGDVIRSLLAYLLGMPLDLSRRLEVAPASRSVVSLFGDEIRVEAINLPPG